MNNKLSLKDLKVKSFVTKQAVKHGSTVKGGTGGQLTNGCGTDPFYGHCIITGKEPLC